MGRAVSPSDSVFDPRYHLAYGDVRFNRTTEPGWMEVHIKRSKCDQYCRGVTLTVGATGMQICPIAAMVGYLVQRGDKPSPLFTFRDGQVLTRDRFVTAIRAALRTRHHMQDTVFEWGQRP